MSVKQAIRFFRLVEPVLRILAKRTDTPIDDKALNFLSDFLDALDASPAMIAALEAHLNPDDGSEPTLLDEAELEFIATAAAL